MKRRILPYRRKMQRERQIEKYTKLTGRSTLVYTIITALALTVVAYTTYQQRGFNERQLGLYELSAIPQVFIRLDSLPFRGEQNIFYSIGNAGNSPALNLKVASNITDTKENLFDEVAGEVSGDVFPGRSIPVSSKRNIPRRETLYLHFRADFEDLRQERYFYKVTYYLLLTPTEDSSVALLRKAGLEHSEYGRLGR